ncbi:hypothetical protein, partial [uncultured Salinisphaera sp.]|uniref:hypothetical protein n=1 Tax=uncultured Salinisphaera sp. TaxID=359372 RepID=UPI0032B13837
MVGLSDSNTEPESVACKAASGYHRPLYRQRSKELEIKDDAPKRGRNHGGAQINILSPDTTDTANNWVDSTRKRNRAEKVRHRKA